MTTCKNDQMLDHFHPSTLRHFERAHMISGEFHITDSTQDEESASKLERCQQWVMRESGCFPRDLASWDGSIKYDSGNSMILESYAGELMTCQSKHDSCCHLIKATQNIESWTSTMSLRIIPVFSQQQEKAVITNDPNLMEELLPLLEPEDDCGEKPKNINNVSNNFETAT